VTIPAPTVDVASSATTPEDKPKEKKPREPKSKPPTGPAGPTGTSFNLIVDASVEGVDAQPFGPILDGIAAEVAALAGDLDLRCAGVRTQPDGKIAFAKDESPCAFGRWEGILAALLRERALPPGYYHLSTRGNRVAEVAAAALVEQCRRTGGIHVWGNR
jgi:hypothetical protein